MHLVTLLLLYLNVIVNYLHLPFVNNRHWDVSVLVSTSSKALHTEYFQCTESTFVLT